MNILDYLNEEKKEIVIKKNPLIELFNLLYSKQYISSFEFTELVNFVNYKNSLVNFGEYQKFINYISNRTDIDEEIRNNIITLSEEHFKHYYDIMTNGVLSHQKIVSDFTNIEANNSEIFIPNKQQRKAFTRIMRFMYDPDKYSYLFSGLAGTGKTTSIVKLISYLIMKKFIKSFVVAAPTHQALTVLKNKMRVGLSDILKFFQINEEPNDTLKVIIDKLKEVKISIKFTTLHKLLGYSPSTDKNGETVFVKSRKDNIKSNMDVIIIDECSMIQYYNVIDIFDCIHQKVLNKNKEKSLTFNVIPKLIFMGDICQLPPVKEKSSAIFIDNDSEFNKEGFYSYVKFNPDEKFMIFKNYILNQDGMTLTKVMRSNSMNVVGICNEIRKWILDEIKIPKLKPFKSDEVIFYNYKKEDKTKTIWFKKALDIFTNDIHHSNIILTWTNKQCNDYNMIMRQYLLKNKNPNEFEVNDILTLSGFYNVQSDNENIKIYSSEQLRVIKCEEVVKVVPKLPEVIKLCTSSKNYIEGYYLMTIKKLNARLCRNYKTWKLTIEKINSDVPVSGVIYVIKKQFELHQKDLDMISDNINIMRYHFTSVLPDKMDFIELEVIDPLWKYVKSEYRDIFANVNYGLSSTTHKAQGSNYYNVFVDMENILKNTNVTEAKRCLYTAMSRTINSIHILV